MTPPSLTPLSGSRKCASFWPPASLCQSHRAARKRVCRRAAAESLELLLAAAAEARLAPSDTINCEARLVEALSQDNCAWLYDAAVTEQREECEQPRVLAVLHEAARDMLLRSLARLTAAQLQPLGLELLCTLLRSDELRDEATAGGFLHEVELLGVIERWCEANSSCRTQHDVRKLLACLRWPLMTMRQLGCLSRATRAGGGPPDIIQLCRGVVHAHVRRCLRWKVVVGDSAAAYRRFARSSTDVGALASDPLLEVCKRRAAHAPGLRQEDAAGQD